MAAFGGFPPEMLEFFAELEKNNSKTWFDQHRETYERYVKQTMLDFVVAVGEKLKKISPEFVADPRIDGSVYRLYRDVRFSKNKMPYKTHTAALFFHHYGKKHEYPAFYFQFSREEILWAGGHYLVMPEQLFRIRSFIANNSGMWNSITQEKRFRARFGEVEGEKLLRPPKLAGVTSDHPAIEVLKLKQYLVSCKTETKAAIGDPGMVDKTIAIFQDAAPFMEMLCIALAIPF